MSLLNGICQQCGEQSNHIINRDYGKIRICRDCDNMNRYEKGEDGFFLCYICGKADAHKN